MILSPGRRWTVASADWAQSTLRESARCRRLGLEGVGWTAARTDVLLGESPQDPGARGAGSSASGRTDTSQHRGHLTGFG